MAGHVLIIDALSNRRIQLQAQIGSACFTLTHSETLRDGLSRIQHDPPDVVIIAQDLPGLNLRTFCQTLRRSPKSQMITVIVAVTSENQSARVATLTAGAADVIDFGINSGDLQARLRNFLRLRQTATEANLRIAPARAVGFADEATAFAHASRIAIICSDQNERQRHRARSIQAHFGADCELVSTSYAQRGLERNVDVIVVFEDTPRAPYLDLLGTLRTHAKTRHSNILYVAGSATGTVSPLDLGAQDYVEGGVSNEELIVRIERLASQTRVEDEARDSVVALSEMAYTDALTGLKNRRFADIFLEKHDRRMADYPQPFAVILADVDHFKRINDTHGHAAGDAILTHIGRTLQDNLREGDMLARYGGEEFLIVLRHVGPQQAKSVAERLRDEVANGAQKLDNGTHLRATVSLGVAHSPRSAMALSHNLLQAADEALYRAKSSGRNKVVIARADGSAPHGRGCGRLERSANPASSRSA